MILNYKTVLMPRKFRAEPGITNKLPAAVVISDCGMTLTISYLAKPT
jgi:hypothetical protein